MNQHFSIDDTPIGGKSLASIMSNNHIDKPEIGMQGLLQKKNLSTVEPTASPVFLERSEFYQLEANKNDLFNKMIEIPNTIKELEAKIEKRQKKNNKLLLSLILLLFSALFITLNHYNTPIIGAASKISETFLSTKFTNVRTKGSQNGQLAYTLYPNQEIKVITKKGSWWKIETFDHLEKKEIKGWVYSKNFIKK